MNLFPGFEEILWCVIENTAHGSEIKKRAGRRRKALSSRESDVRRFKEAMKAIFGSDDLKDALITKHPKPPAGATRDEMLELAKSICEGKPKSRCFKDYARKKKKNSRHADEQAEFFTKVIAQHFRRHGAYYYSIVLPKKTEMPPLPPEILELLEEDAERNRIICLEIKAALRKAGWPI